MNDKGTLGYANSYPESVAGVKGPTAEPSSQAAAAEPVASSSGREPWLKAASAVGKMLGCLGGFAPLELARKMLDEVVDAVGQLAKGMPDTGGLKSAIIDKIAKVKAGKSPGRALVGINVPKFLDMVVGQVIDAFEELRSSYRSLYGARGVRIGLLIIEYMLENAARGQGSIPIFFTKDEMLKTLRTAQALRGYYNRVELHLATLYGGEARDWYEKGVETVAESVSSLFELTPRRNRQQNQAARQLVVRAVLKAAKDQLPRDWRGAL